jgi:hypothetical protein
MDHDRPAALAAGRHVLHVEALRQVEIQLHVEHCHLRPMASSIFRSIFGP